MRQDLERSYPQTARFVREDGWIEIGYDDWNRSFIRALDAGGMVWEGRRRYPSLDAAFQELESALAARRRDHSGA